MFYIYSILPVFVLIHEQIEHFVALYILINVQDAFSWRHPFSDLNQWISQTTSSWKFDDRAAQSLTRL